MAKTARRLATVVLFTLCASALPARAQHTKPPAAKRPAKTAPRSATPAPQPQAPLPPDVVLTTTYSTGDKTSTGTVSIKGARERIEYGNGITAIQQCDAGRTVQLNEQTKTYLVTPFHSDEPTPPPPAGKAKGGVVTYTTSVTDTGEKKVVSGFTARHLLTVMVKDATPTACDRTAERVETDGWYIELPQGLGCSGATAAQPRRAARDAECRDEVKYVQATPPAAGYPISYTMKASTGSAAPVTTTMEASDVKRVSLDATLMEVPDGYLEVSTVAQLTADHRPGEAGPKKPGTVRVGVAPVANRTDQQVATDTLSQALAESLGETDLDVVLLRGSTRPELEADAKSKECDYILQNSVSELKKPGKGMLGKFSGTSGDEIAAKVDFAVAPPGQPQPTFAASERSGTSALRTVVGAAKRVAKIVTPFMMPQFAMMGAFQALSTGASPAAMLQTPDPVLNSVFALLDRATAPKDTQRYTSEEAAVAAAMEKEVQALAAEVGKRIK